MRLNKKGALELSVNAIVILIIALSIMGLILTFGVTQFNRLTKELTFTEQTPEPDYTNPIQLPGGRTSLNLDKQTKLRMNIKVYNSEGIDLIIEKGSSGGTGAKVDCSVITTDSLCNNMKCTNKGSAYNVICDGNGNPDVLLCNEVPKIGANSANGDCVNVGCENPTTGTMCVSPSAGPATGETGLTCAPSSINTNLDLEVVTKTLGPGEIKDVPVILEVKKAAIPGEYVCTLNLGGIEKTIDLNIK